MKAEQLQKLWSVISDIDEFVESYEVSTERKLYVLEALAAHIQGRRTKLLARTNGKQFELAWGVSRAGKDDAEFKRI